MEPTPIRCPHCKKKQEEPCPKRCGCGQSLLALLAARRAAEKPPAGALKAGRRGLDRPQVLSVKGSDLRQPAASTPRDDNEW